MASTAAARRLLDALAAARALDDPDRLDAALDASPERLRPALADQLGLLLRQALTSHHYEQAARLGRVTAAVNTRMRRTVAAIDARVLGLQADYQQAATEDAYLRCRDGFRAAARDAEAARAGHLSLVARGFAAHCGYFAGELVDSASRRQELIETAVDHLREALEAHPTTLSNADATLFFEFSFAVLDRATAITWPRPETMHAALRALRTAIDERVPAKAALASDPKRETGIAACLGRLASVPDT